MKKIVMGILAHVDVGKTTLAEAMLYESGNIRKIGRVDNRDTFLDTHALERSRGITIFSKQAILNLEHIKLTLLDTPGHIDFSAEMERTLQVMDYAILVVSAVDGIQAHTHTLWRLLDRYHIPTFIFVNKMDYSIADKAMIMQELRSKLSGSCVDFTENDSKKMYEEIAICNEGLLEKFVSGNITKKDVQKAIRGRSVFPIYFGSALKLEGVSNLLKGIEEFTEEIKYSMDFGAKVFKISRDLQGNRLTHLKITGGTLRVRMSPKDNQEKINQIRIYSGLKYDSLPEAEAGDVCAVTGLISTYSGEGLGIERRSASPIIEPVLSYVLILPPECDANVILPRLRQLEEEEPEFRISWDEVHKQIHIKLMGEVQIEVLKSSIAERFGIEVELGEGTIVYKETIAEVQKGAAHYEVQGHYAEVHVLLEPLPRGTGLQFETDCDESMLDIQWQRIVLQCLKGREIKGVMVGAAINDMRVTLIAGKAYSSRSSENDFREATYRAVRQGLMQATSVLLEPYYDFYIEVPEAMLGRTMTDIAQLGGVIGTHSISSGVAFLIGYAPVNSIQNYQQEIISYTKGFGRMFTTLRGYEECHNTAEVMDKYMYVPSDDINNPSSSIFYSGGVINVVEWDKAWQYMHVKRDEDTDCFVPRRTIEERESIGLDEIEEIIQRTFYANKGKNDKSKYYKKFDSKKIIASNSKTYEGKTEQRERYLLVDGYNIIFAWEELKELANISLESARNKLQDVMCNYQALVDCKVMVVFDAYRVKGNDTKLIKYHNIDVVFTKEAQTADSYIERFVHENSENYHITVATSDGLEQVIVRGANSHLLSARELWDEVLRAAIKCKEELIDKQESNSIYLGDYME